jgi:mannose-1-phosphate guanylyltransferase
MPKKPLPNHVYAVILAGGSGTRFWPKSRLKSPKQLCRIGGGAKTMLETTLSRLDGFIPPERRLIITHADQAQATAALVKDLCPLIIAEPDARNTANALALAALEIENRQKLLQGARPVMISLHADHVVEHVDRMLQSFETAVTLAERQNALVLMGIVPRYPETGYGYIEKGETCDGLPNAFRVASFREKPNLETATKFIAAKRFFWNAGLFVFPVAALLNELTEKLPQSINSLRNLLGSDYSSYSQVPRDAFERVYKELPKISIDHAVLEVSKNVFVVEADIGWQDVGSWEALAQCFKVDASRNFIDGPVITLDTQDSVVETDGPLVATLGLKGMVVVHAKGAILVCPKDRSQDVKLIVDQLKSTGLSQFT